VDTPSNGEPVASSAEHHLVRVDDDGLSWFTDARIRTSDGIVVAFSTRLGGASGAPYDSLDLAAHSGDDPVAVDENRRRLVTGLGLDPCRLVTAEQVHGDTIETVAGRDAGRGGTAVGGPLPLPATDAMLTSEPATPLLMMYADCVPVVLAARGPVRSVAVVHAGWRGALVSLPALAARALATHAGCSEADLDAWVGPHIGPCHYEVDEELAEAFRKRFPGVSRPADATGSGPRVDLGEAVRQALLGAGLCRPRITELGLCTADHLELFYSYRAEGLTGRHGAVAAILPEGSGDSS
jgi:YfiH family protein